MSAAENDWFTTSPENVGKFLHAFYEIDVSELAKAEGAVTCCSLIFADRVLPQPA